MPDKADPDIDQGADQLASTIVPHAGISQLKGVECCSCVDGIDSPTQDFASTIMLINCHGCHNYDSGVTLIMSRGNGAPAQEGPL
jgi:hypothetical protein